MLKIYSKNIIETYCMLSNIIKNNANKDFMHVAKYLRIFYFTSGIATETVFSYTVPYKAKKHLIFNLK